MISTTIRKKAAALVLVAAPLLTLGLAGCSAGTGSPSPSSTPSMSLSDYRLKMSQCLRANGVDVSDPDENGVEMQSGGAQANDNGQMQAAMDACLKELGKPPAMSDDEKKQQQKAQQEASLKMAKCYRDNGVDVPDPQPGKLPQIPENAPKSVQQECGGGSNMTTRGDG
jgi:hypothetical protein